MQNKKIEIIEEVPPTIPSPSSDEIKSGERLKMKYDSDYEETFTLKTLDRLNKDDDAAPITQRTPHLPPGAGTEVKKSK